MSAKKENRFIDEKNVDNENHTHDNSSDNNDNIDNNGSYRDTHDSYHSYNNNNEDTSQSILGNCCNDNSYGDTSRGGPSHFSNYNSYDDDPYRGVTYLSNDSNNLLNSGPEEPNMLGKGLCMFDSNTVDLTVPYNFDHDSIQCEINHIDDNYDQQQIVKQFDSNFCVGDTLKIKLDMNKIRGIFEKLVNDGLIDFHHDESNPHIVEGRIYTTTEDAEFRCQFHKQSNTNDYLLEIYKIAGEAFCFADFRKRFFDLLREEKLTDNSTCETNNFNNDINFGIESISNEPEYLNYNDNNSCNDSASLLSIFSNNDIIFGNMCDQYLNLNDGDNNSNNKIIDENEARSLLQRATDSNSYREIFRDNVATLRHIVNDVDNAKIFAEVENVFDQILAPIIQIQTPLLDCWIIKTLLEVILKLIPVSKSKCSINDITSIKEKWNKHVDHPFGITKFFPSNQIQRVCSDIINESNK